MGRALATYASGDQLGLLPVVLPHLEAYARQHGYQLVVADPDLPLRGRSGHWAKVRILQELLGEHETVVWVDNDIVLRDQGSDLLDWMCPEDFQALCMEHGRAGPAPNTGLWALRDTPQAHAFLRAVWEMGPRPDATLNDQATVASLLGFSYLPDRTRPLNPSRWLAGTGWLDPLWNTLLVHHPHAGVVGRGVHFGGVSVARKRMLMSQQIINDRLPGWETLLREAEAE